MAKATPERVIAQAKKWVGYVEKKSNKDLDDFTKNAGSNNYTRFNRDYMKYMNSGSINMQWCAAFVSCMFAYEFGLEAAKKLLCKTLHCYTPSGAQYFKDKGQYTKRTKANPKPGDVVFFYSTAKGRIGHVGIVTKVDSSKIYTIEGNTSGGSSLVTNGGAVWSKSYSKTSQYIDGYGRPPYDSVEVPDEVPDAAAIEPTKTEPGKRTLEKGMTGSDVKAMQEALIKAGYDLGKYGADGDFGSDTEKAVKQFQKNQGLGADGIVGPATWAAIDKLSTGATPADNGTVSVTGATVNVRSQPNTTGAVIGIAKLGEKLSYRGEEKDGWFAVRYKDKDAWISGKYAKRST